VKRSEINAAIRQAQEAFAGAGWVLPPKPRWDVTDFGLGRFAEKGLVLVNLAEEPEYCEKIMYARRGQKTPAHCHAHKKEDIVVRRGALRVQVWKGKPGSGRQQERVAIGVNSEHRLVSSGSVLDLTAGERITLCPGIFHEFWPTSEDAVIGEVSTANDDAHDNFFADPAIGRFPAIEEDEPALVRLVSECAHA
jgi:D-lyxose ketol-isomerase